MQTYLKVGMVYFGLLTSSVGAQTTEHLRVYCDKTPAIVKKIQDNFNEEKFVVGQGEEGSRGEMSVWKNNQTGSWTILYTIDDISCIIGGGKRISMKIS